MELKKSHLFRLVGEVWVHLAGSIPMWIKIWEGYLGSKEPQTHTRCPSPGLQCQEDKSPQLLAVVIQSVEEAAGALSNSSWGAHTRSQPIQTCSLWVQNWDGSLKGTVVYRERFKCLASGWAKATVPLLSSPPTEPIGWCHIWDSINLANTVWPTMKMHRGSVPPSVWAHPSCFSTRMAGLDS